MRLAFYQRTSAQAESGCECVQIVGTASECVSNGIRHKTHRFESVIIVRVAACSMPAIRVEPWSFLFASSRRFGMGLFLF